SLKHAVAEVVAPQTPLGLLIGHLVGEAALDTLEVPFPLLGLLHGQLAASAAGALPQVGGGNLDIHSDFVLVAQVLINVGSRHLTGGNGLDNRSRAGDAVAAGKNSGVVLNVA